MVIAGYHLAAAPCITIIVTNRLGDHTVDRAARNLDVRIDDERVLFKARAPGGIA